MSMHPTHGRNTALRAVNEVSLAAWFGGSLMGAVALPRAAGGQPHPVQAEGAGWRAWRPVQNAAVVAQLVSGAGLTLANRGRVAGQRGVATTSAVRTALTGAALAATFMAAREGSRAAQEASSGDGDTGDGAGAAADGGQELEQALVATRVAQWAVPVLTGGMLVLDALMGEQQRPHQVVGGVLGRVLPDPVAERLAA